MTLVAIGLAIVMVRVDDTDTVRQFAARGWLYAGRPQGATVLLSTIAGSLIAVAGTIYAVTIAVLTFASTQFGPRLLRNFLRDRSNQLVLGAYVATFMYSLLVIRSIGDPGGGAPDHPNLVPHASIAVAMLAEAICVGLLIYFIHHTAVSIQAPAVIANISRDLMHSITRLYPGTMGLEPPPAEYADAAADALTRSDEDAACVRFSHRGYIQALDGDRLMRLAESHDLVLRLECGPGDYVSAGDVLARIWPAANVTPRLDRALNDLFVLGWERTQLQDHEYHLNQLVEIAVRALSPAINDPFTAMQCLDRLTEALRSFAQQDQPSPCRYDGSGHLRVVTTNVQTFAELTSICFDKIRCYGQSSVDVTIRLLDGLASIATWARRPADLAVVERHAVMLERGSRTAIAEEWDRDRIDERFKRVMAAIGSPNAPAQRT
jgi:uncharacterized membrane protein